MKKNRLFAFVLAGLALGAFAGPARADDPAFEYKKPEDVKPDSPEKSYWKANANAGLIATTGNAQSVSFSAGAMLMRNDGKNRVELDVGGAYARSTIYQANDKPDILGMTNGTIDGPDEIKSIKKPSASNWNIKLRYDRFFTTNNALYIAALTGADYPAGKELYAAGQIGYTRQFYKTKMHEFYGEIGYDLGYLNYVDPTAKYLLAHSARLFLSYILSVNADTSLAASVETLANVAPEDVPVTEVTPDGRATYFQDVRVNGKLAFTTRIWKALSFRAAFTAKYDNVPAPRPALDLPWGADYHPAAAKFDTITEVGLIVNFL